MNLVKFALIALTLSTPALADNLDITCRTLGDIGQCESVSICHQSRTVGSCRPAESVRGEADWARACPAAGPTQQLCGWQTFCQWEEHSDCVPLRRQ
ncbi:MAG: hypothetical protein ACXWQO_02415 [Bdellovibrionota bacterium]